MYTVKKLRLVFFACIVSLLAACVPPTNDINNLTFSNSPFSLSGTSAKFAQNIAYDDKERTVFDIFLPKSSQTTPLVIFIHGGGFIRGDKSSVYSASSMQSAIKEFISHDIAFAAINYSFLDTHSETVGVKKSLYDAKRALQFMRYHASTLNINKNKVVLIGSSAGAGTSLWIATHDDMAAPNSNDPILQESTRVSGIALMSTQATYDLESWATTMFADDYGVTKQDVFDTLGSANFLSFYGINSFSEYKTPQMDAYRASVDMLDLMTSDDPEIWVNNTSTENAYPSNASILYHHAFHARAIVEKANKVGIPIIARYGNPILFDNTNKSLKEGKFTDFAIRKLSQ